MMSRPRRPDGPISTSWRRGNGEKCRGWSGAHRAFWATCLRETNEEEEEEEGSPPSSGESTELPDHLRNARMYERQNRNRDRDRQQQQQHPVVGADAAANNINGPVVQEQPQPRESPNMVVTQLGTDLEDNNDEDVDDDENAVVEENENNENTTATAAGSREVGAGGGGDMMMTLPTQTYPVPQMNSNGGGGGGDRNSGTGIGTQDDEEEGEEEEAAYNAPAAAATSTRGITATTTTTTIRQRQTIADEVSRLLERQVQSETRRLRAQLSAAQSTASTLRTDLRTVRAASRQTAEATEAAHRTQLAAMQSQLDAALADAAAAMQQPPKCDCGDTIVARLEGQIAALRSDLRTAQRKLAETNDKYQRTKRMAKGRDAQLRNIARVVQEQQRERGEDGSSPGPAFSPSQSQRMGELLGGLGGLDSNEDSGSDTDDDGGGGGDGGSKTSEAAKGKGGDGDKSSVGDKPVTQRTQPPPPPTAQEHRKSYVKQLFPAEDTASTANGDIAPKESLGRRPPPREEEDKASHDASDHEEMDETPMTEPLLPRKSSPPKPAKQGSTKTGQDSSKRDAPRKKTDSADAAETATAPAPTVAALPRNPYAKPSNKASSASNDTAAKSTSAGGLDRGRAKPNTRSTGGSGDKRKRSSSPHGGDPTHRTAGAGTAPSGLRSLVASAVAAAVPQGLARHPQPKKRKGRDGSTGTAAHRVEKENRENRTTAKKMAGNRSDIPIPSFSSSPCPSSSSAHKGADTTKARGNKRTSDTIVIDSDDESSEDESGEGERVQKQAKNQMAPPPPRRRTMSPPVPVRTVEVASRGSKTADGKYSAQYTAAVAASASIRYNRIPNRKGKGGKASADDSEEPGYKFQEVVRDKDRRRAMKGFECEHCRAFYEALAKGGSGKDFNREEMVCQHSRHRSNHAPDLTPDGFWELSFIDSQKSPSQHFPGTRRDEDV
mmetsp:Transcript_11833/g.33805  ORF Transcript_11833/g.33805 Transcript_11833/m.33805 type:complete len:948 (-) Transcript_11833:2940-5783(-)